VPLSVIIIGREPYAEGVAKPCAQWRSGKEIADGSCPQSPAGDGGQGDIGPFQF